MNDPTSARHRPVHTYNNGTHYKIPRGRYAPRDAVESHLPCGHSVVSGFPTTETFLHTIEQTLKIRMYAASSQKSYLNHVRGFLRWHGNRPSSITRQDVCNYLELLVDGGASASQIAGCLSAIRTCFDKFCGRDVTLGLATPRRRKRQPVVPSTSEVTRIINAAPTRAAKLAIGILYAAGLRNSELCRLKVRDIDFERKTIRVHQGKGCSDRLVMLPQTWQRPLADLCHDQRGNCWLFPSLKLNGRTDRHMSPRTLQRWVTIATQFAAVKKKITPHSFRHAFATHLLECGTDIRYIQKLLGHQRLETTTIYTKVAQIPDQVVRSPIDQLPHPISLDSSDSLDSSTERPPSSNASRQTTAPPSVGKLKIHFKQMENPRRAKVTLEILRHRPRPNPRSDDKNKTSEFEQRVFLPGILVERTEQNWVQLTMPDIADWKQPMGLLSAAEVDRINSAEFYETLRSQICQRFLNLF